MKFPLKLSRSPRSHPSPTSTSPPPASPAPSSSPTSSPPSSSPKKPRFPLPSLGRSSSKKLEPPSCDISSPKSPSPSHSFSRGKAKVSGASFPSSSTSTSAHPHGDPFISEAQMHEIQQVFAQFDTNGDGKISADELRAVLASLGDEATREEAALMVREVDIDGDGYIDLGEFVNLNARCSRAAAAEEEMAAAFAVFDLEKNGRITAEGLQEVLRRLGGSVGRRTSVEDCKRMIRGIDRKGRGHVDFDDFKRMMSPITF